LEIIHDERIIESYIPIEGHPIADIAKDDWNAYQPKYLDKGGESLQAIWNRMNEFFKEKIEHHAGEEIVVVSHGDPIMISASQHAGKPLTVESIRGEEYVQTAHGFEITISQDTTTINVTPIIP
jgi:broad specificity phosphatase PhoE